jgi:hypothetical protein
MSFISATPPATFQRMNYPPSARAEKELRKTLARVAAGEPVAESGMGAEYDAAARALLALHFAPGIPDFINDAITKLLGITAAKTGTELWREVAGDEEKGGYSALTLARVFASHSRLRLEIEERPDLAERIAAILHDPNTPTEIRRALDYAISALFNDRVTHSADYLRLLFAKQHRDHLAAQ